jgi:hypothetical protein
MSLVFSKKQKRQRVKIMTAQRNLNKLIQRKQIRESILGNTFEFTEGEGKAVFNKLLKLNNPHLRRSFGKQVCACPVRRVFSNGAFCG